jgi:hypothetical protein
MLSVGNLSKVLVCARMCAVTFTLSVIAATTDGCSAQVPAAKTNPVPNEPASTAAGSVQVSQAQIDAARKRTAEAAEARKKLLKLAKKKGWALEIKQADGRTISLVGVDARGMPQYMTTDAAKSPSEPGPIPPVKREQTTAPSDSALLKN